MRFWEKKEEEEAANTGTCKFCSHAPFAKDVIRVKELSRASWGAPEPKSIAIPLAKRRLITGRDCGRSMGKRPVWALVQCKHAAQLLEKPEWCWCYRSEPCLVEAACDSVRCETRRAYCRTLQPVSKKRERCRNLDFLCDYLVKTKPWHEKKVDQKCCAQHEHVTRMCKIMGEAHRKKNLWL